MCASFNFKQLGCCSLLALVALLAFTDGAISRPRPRSPLLSQELKTENDEVIKNHPNFKLLPNVTECGFTAKSNVTSTSGNKTEEADKTRKARLVGGNFPALGTLPWAARIELIDGDSGNTTLRCGASLISSKYVLTSARCLTAIPATHTLNHVTLGVTDRRKDTQCIAVNSTVCVNATKVEIEKVIMHEEFVQGSGWNDVALLRLTEEVKFSNYVRPVCLPTNDNLLDKWEDNQLTAYGWGRQESDDESEPYHYSWNIQGLNISLVSREQCDRVYRRHTGKLSSSRFCAGGEPEKGTCKADTGGALFKPLNVTIASDKDYDRRHYQFGIIHMGRCAMEGIPNIYMNVLHYMPWILNNMSE